MSNLLNSLLSLFRGNTLPQQLQEMGIRTTPDGTTLHLQNRIGQHIALTDTKVIIQDTNGNTITLDTTGIHIQASAKVDVACSQLEVSAGQVSVNSGMVKISGTVQCDTIIATNVVGTTYTPGAGNIW